MKIVLILLFVFIAGCSENKDLPLLTFEECISGVVYYKSGYRLAPAFKVDGTLYLCDSPED